MGIDKFLTSQRQDKEKTLRKKRKIQLRRELRQPLRQEALKKIRELKDAGHSVEQISASMIKPVVGKGKNKKKSLRDAMAQKIKQDKVKATKSKDKAATAENENEVCFRFWGGDPGLEILFSVRILLGGVSGAWGVIDTRVYSVSWRWKNCDFSKGFSFKKIKFGHRFHFGFGLDSWAQGWFWLLAIRLVSSHSNS